MTPKPDTAAAQTRAALALAMAALEEAEAILGGEYGDSYAVLCEQMLGLREAIAALDAAPSQPTAGSCAKCGGPHPFDTSIPSHQWNRVIRAAGLPDYLCTTCIVAAFALAGQGFTAELYGQSDGRADPLSEDAADFDLHGVSIEVRVGGRDLETVRELRDENNRLRSALGALDRGHPLLTEFCRPPMAAQPTAREVLEELLTHDVNVDGNPWVSSYRIRAKLVSLPTQEPSR